MVCEEIICILSKIFRKSVDFKNNLWLYSSIKSGLEICIYIYKNTYIYPMQIANH